jgi:hypothetical protein
VGLVYIWVHPIIVVGLVCIWDHPNIVVGLGGPLQY